MCELFQPFDVRCLGFELAIGQSLNRKVATTTMMTIPTVQHPTVPSGDTGSTDSEGDPLAGTFVQPSRQNGVFAKTNLVSLRVPIRKDGQAIHQLIKQCPPLDLNSVYTYLLLCEHFQQTCVVAELDGQLCGFVSAYIHPSHSDVLFVWQVAVHERARGIGLGQQMLMSLLNRPLLRPVRFLETTVGPDNVPSRRMFHGVANDCQAKVKESALFESELFGSEGHDDECLLRIGPITLKTTKEYINEN